MSEAGMIRIKAIVNEADYGDVCNLLRKSQKAETEATGVLFNTKGLSPEQLKDEISRYDGVCYCAYEGTEMAGTLTVFTNHKKNWYSTVEPGRIIKYVAVAPGCQGKGIATKLLECAKHESDGRVLSVSTGEKNTHAVQLYSKNGFILVDVRRGPINNAYKFAYWENGCPINPSRLRMHIFAAKAKCALKKLLFKPKVTEDVFR